MSHYISSEAPDLTSRERGLVKIGQSAIAQQNDVELDNYFSCDFTFHGPAGVSTYPELKMFFSAMRAAFSNFRCERTEIISEGDLVATRTTMSGVFTGRFVASPVGPIDPNGETVTLNLINFFRYDEEGKLAEEWVQYDSLGFLKQLGVDLVAMSKDFGEQHEDCPTNIDRII